MTFWFLSILLNDFKMRDLFKIGMNGFEAHLENFSNYIKSKDEELNYLVVQKKEGYSVIEIVF